MNGAAADRPGDARPDGSNRDAGGRRAARSGTRRPARALDPIAIAAAVRDACVQAAIEAFEDAGVRGLCGEGALEYALDAIRRLDLGAVVRAARRAADGSANAAG
ncbi:MAG TPA: hypothetical protein VF212_10335 [Longimicrobiales bacterium]